MSDSPARARAAALRRLRHTLSVIARIDPSRESAPDGPDTPAVAARYAHRSTLVLTALAYARQAGVPAGVGYDGTDVHPVVVYLELPTGQVSWHIADHPIRWDGHSTTTKYERISAFLRA